MNNLLDKLFEAGRRKTVVGYRGVNFDENNRIIPNLGVGTEGNGVYIADTEHTASFFGDVVAVEYYPPRNPMIVDEEPLYLLHEMDEIMDPIEPGDSVWARVNKEAVKRAGATDQNWNLNKVAAALTDILKERGYDGVRVTSDGESWTVLFNQNDVISMSESLVESEDDRARFVRQHREERERDVRNYSKKNVLAVAEDGEFRVEIHTNRRYFLFHKSKPNDPVPGGFWMGFWDPDLKVVLDIDEPEYNQMIQIQKAEADAEVQLKKYVHEQYWDNYARFYLSNEYDEHGMCDSWVTCNDYWRRRLSESRVVRFLSPRGGEAGEAVRKAQETKP